MVNLNELERRIKHSGLKLGHIADQCGISYAGFRNKITGKSPFLVSDVETLRDVLNLSDADTLEIFLPKTRN